MAAPTMRGPSPPRPQDRWRATFWPNAASRHGGHLMTTTERRALPMRRVCETFEVAYGGLSKAHTVSVGYYADGTPGEIFINGGKSGETVEAIARDGAVLL